MSKNKIVEEYYNEKYKTDDYVGLNYDPLHYHQMILKKIKERSGTKSILDIGCSTGYLGQEIKKCEDAKVVGIDISRKALHRASAVLDEVILGDIEKMNPTWPQNYFDIIICADILEHLFDPKAVLTKIRKYLKPDGLLLLSMPNVAYWKLRLKLLMGQWEYQEKGIFEEGHIRFYTKKGSVSLIKRAGYSVKEIHPWVPLFSRFRKDNNKFATFVSEIITKICPTLLGHSFLYIASKKR